MVEITGSSGTVRARVGVSLFSLSRVHKGIDFTWKWYVFAFRLPGFALLELALPSCSYRVFGCDSCFIRNCLSRLSIAFRRSYLDLLVWLWIASPDWHKSSVHWIANLLAHLWCLPGEDSGYVCRSKHFFTNLWWLWHIFRSADESLNIAQSNESIRPYEPSTAFPAKSSSLVEHSSVPVYTRKEAQPGIQIFRSVDEEWSGKCSDGSFSWMCCVLWYWRWSTDGNSAVL